MGKGQEQPVWAPRLKVKPSEINMLFCSGRDVRGKPPADELLIPYDIWLNKAHGLMLFKQKIISKEVFRQLMQALDEISNLYRKNQFHLQLEKEDVHLNIEHFIDKEKGPEVAGWLHTARSRNDQAATDLRLFIRDRLLELFEGTMELIETILKKAGKHLSTVMPGLTHTQFAAITTLAHYLTSYAQALTRDLLRMRKSFDVLNQSPLGAVACFGTSWEIDRHYVAELLGFSHPLENSLDCITNRWEIEADVATTVAFFLTHLGIIAEDLILFSISPMNFITIDDRYVTGSSVMPQKRNLDFAEVVRAKAAAAIGHSQAIFNIARGSGSGYNRDVQWTKYLLVDIFDEAHYAPRLFSDVIRTLKVNKKEMEQQSQQGFLNAVEVTDFLSRKFSIPFRVAYQIVARAVKHAEKSGQLELALINKALKDVKIKVEITKSEWEQLGEPLKVVERKKHFGGPAPSATKVNVRNLTAELHSNSQWYKRTVHKLNQAKAKLASDIKKSLA